MSQKTYKTNSELLAEVYEKSGVQGAIDEVKRRGLTNPKFSNTLRYCRPCDANQPVLWDTFRIDGVKTHICECAVCGSSFEN